MTNKAKKSAAKTKPKKQALPKAPSSAYAGKKLQEANLFLESIIEHIPHMIFVKEADDLRFVRFNKAGEDLIGHSRKEMIGKNDYDFFPKDQAAFFVEKDRDVLEHGGVLDIPEEPLQTPEGTRYLHTKKIPIIDSNGKPIYLLGISEDITKRKEAEDKIKKLTAELEQRVVERTAELEEANQKLREEIKERKKIERDLNDRNAELERANLELDSFAYTASHDLKAPLRGIASFATFLETDCGKELSAEGIEHISRIREGVIRMGELIQDLAMLSRVSRLAEPGEQVILGDLLHRVLARCEFDLARDGIQVRVPGQLPTILANEVSLAEVFLNLINNAIKFTHKTKGKDTLIEILYQDSGEDHEFCIRDNGIGIDAKHHNRVFGIFKRLHSNEEYEGTGAGLNIVERIVEGFGGRIWIDSKLDEGASFFFTVPKDPITSRRKEYE